MPGNHAGLLLSLRRPSQYGVDGFRKEFNPSCELHAFFGGCEKFGSVEKAVRTVEYGDERRSIGSMRDMDVAARSPHEVTRSTAAFRVFQRSFEHEGLFECGVLVQWHDRAGRHLEQDGRAPFVVLVQDLHLYSVELRSLPGHRRRGDEGRPKFGRVDGQRLVHGFFSEKSTALLTRSRRPTPCPRCRSTPRVWALALVPWSQAGTGLARSPPPIPSPRSSVRQQGPGRATRCSPSGQNNPAGH